jgi:hypothetical protein
MAMDRRITVELWMSQGPPRCASAMTDFQIPRKEIQISRNEIQPGRSKIQTQILGFPSPNRALSRSYADPIAFFLFAPVPASKGPPQRGGARSLRAVCRSFCLHFESSSLMKRVKGWRHFDRGLRLCETLGRHFRPTSAAASLKGENRREPSRPCGKAAGPAEKTGQSIRRPARMRPLEKNSIRLEPLASGRAPALHASGVSHNPCL